MVNANCAKGVDLIKALYWMYMQYGNYKDMQRMAMQLHHEEASHKTIKLCLFSLILQIEEAATSLDSAAEQRRRTIASLADRLITKRFERIVSTFDFPEIVQLQVCLHEIIGTNSSTRIGEIIRST